MKKSLAALLIAFSFSVCASTAKGVWEKLPRKLGDEGSVRFDLGRAEGSFYVEGLPAKGADLGEMKVLDVETKRDDKGAVAARMKVLVFGIGEIKPAPLQLKILTEKGEVSFEALIDPLTMEGRLSGSEQPPSAAGLVELPKPFPMVPLLAAIVSALLLAGLLIFLVRKKPGKAAAKEELTVEKSPDEWLVLRLKAYVTKPLLSLKDYADLSYDIRLYLEKKKEMKALEWTTFELEETLSVEKPFRELDIKRFLSIFTFCDFVKFARHFPEEGEEAELKLVLRDFIREVEAAMREERRAA